jgi:hypothetical protein
LDWTGQEGGCACLLECAYFRELTPEEIEYIFLTSRFVHDSNVERKQNLELHWIVIYSILGIIAFTGKRPLHVRLLFMQLVCNDFIPVTFKNNIIISSMGTGVSASIENERCEEKSVALPLGRKYS